MFVILNINQDFTYNDIAEILLWIALKNTPSESYAPFSGIHGRRGEIDGYTMDFYAPNVMNTICRCWFFNKHCYSQIKRIYVSVLPCFIQTVLVDVQLAFWCTLIVWVSGWMKPFCFSYITVRTSYISTRYWWCLLFIRPTQLIRF
jgi:hypothetical protein